MDDLNQQISQFLSDPNNMRQLQSMMNSLGLGGDNQHQPQAQTQAPPPQEPAPAPDLSALAGALGALGGLGGLGQNQSQAPPPLPGADSLAMAAKLAPLLGQMNREDDSTRLRMALRPLLGADKQKKIDEAVKILQLMRLLPMLRDMGGLPGLMPGLGI